MVLESLFSEALETFWWNPSHITSVLNGCIDVVTLDLYNFQAHPVINTVVLSVDDFCRWRLLSAYRFRCCFIGSVRKVRGAGSMKRYGVRPSVCLFHSPAAEACGGFAAVAVK